MFDPRPWLLSCLYTAALFFSVPLSLAVWYIRRELIQETTVAGDTQLGGLSIRSSENTDRVDTATVKRDFEIRVDH
ncbi:hypothetical protein ANCCEY_15859 [Ancylostoma ceylanicum]|uniref:Uncharacterized protein n=1 Tax=Ancylostoma ceylanicum TaxID=53326 RepID=A0A0D6L415_9BILA|nr:hypothetical protein ANCCEY_15859 [Ancylostoma ceylanicum]